MGGGINLWSSGNPSPRPCSMRFFRKERADFALSGFENCLFLERTFSCTKAPPRERMDTSPKVISFCWVLCSHFALPPPILKPCQPGGCISTWRIPQSSQESRSRETELRSWKTRRREMRRQQTGSQPTCGWVTGNWESCSCCSLCLLSQASCEHWAALSAEKCYSLTRSLIFIYLRYSWKKQAWYKHRCIRLNPAEDSEDVSVSHMLLCPLPEHVTFLWPSALNTPLSNLSGILGDISNWALVLFPTSFSAVL